MKDQVVIVFGASSGIGEATARAAKDAGARVIAVGRSPSKLAAVEQRHGVETRAVDAADREAVRAFFDGVGRFDHLLVALSGGKGAGPFRELDLEDIRTAFEAKVLGQLTVAQAALRTIRPDGSITLITAASARSIMRNTAGLAAVNGALESMIPILAYELGPVRVNAISPGIVDTAWWDQMPASMKQEFFRAAEAKLPVGRVGNAEEVARLALFLMGAGFVTGSIYEIDGGNHLVSQ